MTQAGSVFGGEVRLKFTANPPVVRLGGEALHEIIQGDFGYCTNFCFCVFDVIMGAVEESVLTFSH